MLDPTEGFRNWVRSERAEGSYEITEIAGEIPRELNGTLYRNGPSQNVEPRAGHAALHVFDGDAYVNAFRFDDGRVRHQASFVRTESFLFEEKHGQYCMNGGMQPADVVLENTPGRHQPNTNIVHHAGRLLALVENAAPFEIDAQTLAPLGSWDLDGRMLSYSTTAHPKIDGRTGQCVIHGYSPFAPFVQFYTIEADGRVSLAEPVDAPYATMMHDIAITEHYAIFPLCPVLLDAEALVSGKPYADAFVWDGSRPIRFGVRGREPGAQTRWFEAPSTGYMFHFGNAYEEDQRLIFDACVYRDGGALLKSLRTLRGGDVRGFYAQPVSFELDLARGSVNENPLDERGAEFPRIDDRLVGYRNRWGYAALTRVGGRETPESTLTSLARYDRTGGPSIVHPFGRTRWVGEPVFVARSPDAAEDEGFVLCTVYDGEEDCSELVILDAQNFAAPPLARARLRHRVPLGFHGNFAGGL